MKTDLFQSCGHCWLFQVCWHIECSTFTASSFRIWNCSTGILSPPLTLFVVMLPRPTWLHIPGCLALGEWSSWLSGSWRSFLYSSSVYSWLGSANTQQRRRQWQPTPVLLLGKSHGRRSLEGCSPWGREESDTTEQLDFHFSLSCTGEGNGNTLQCSFLENPGTGEPGGLPSMGSHRIRHDWSDLAAAAAIPNRLGSV